MFVGNKARQSRIDREGPQEITGSNINGEKFAMDTRSVIAGEKPNGTLQNVNLSRDGNFLVDIDNIRNTSFDELKVASRFAQIELKSAVDQISNLRNFVTETNGTVSVETSGEYKLATSTTTGAVATLESGERGRYIPGYEAEVGVGIRVPEQDWRGTAKFEWGYFDDQNGVGYGIDRDGIYVFIKREGVITKKVYQRDWNADTLDGSGNENNPSGFAYDVIGGNVTQIEFVWYGYGAIQWFINIKSTETRRGSIPISVHTELPDGATSIAQPNLPIAASITNGDQATEYEAYVGGRQFSIYGQPTAKFRVTGERRASVSLSAGTWTPLISLRRKSGIGNNQSVEVSDVNIVPADNVYFSFVTGGSLTGASFGALSDFAANETVVESDISATAITGGTFFGGLQIALASAKNSPSLGVISNLDFDFVNTDIVTLVAQPVSGTSTISVCTMNIKEQW